MQIKTLVVALFASVSMASVQDATVPGLTLAGDWRRCGIINGNCYDNDCNGERSRDGMTCTTGPYAGCPCGYGCGATNGPCYENGCDGYYGRCQNEYRGCTCNEY